MHLCYTILLTGWARIVCCGLHLESKPFPYAFTLAIISSGIVEKGDAWLRIYRRISLRECQPRKMSYEWYLLGHDGIQERPNLVRVGAPKDGTKRNLGTIDFSYALRARVNLWLT